MSDDGLNDGPEPSLRQNSDDSFVSGKEKRKCVINVPTSRRGVQAMIGTSEKR